MLAMRQHRQDMLDSIMFGFKIKEIPTRFGMLNTVVHPLMGNKYREWWNDELKETT